MDNKMMNKNSFFIRVIRMVMDKLRINVLLLTTALFSGSVLAADIAQSPLFLQHSATPNIMFILDDSGSMDWDILTVPHWKAQNYDHDYTRSWAKGGTIWWAEQPTNSLVTDGSWSSYSGYCEDRNADGICHNHLDLNGVGGTRYTNNGETAGVEPVVAVPSYKLKLLHYYYREYTTGKCKTAGSQGDASDYLPRLDTIVAFLTGTRDAVANTWDLNYPPTTSAPALTAGSTHSAYSHEEYKHKGNSYDINDWEVPAEGSQLEQDKEDCLALNGTWVRNDNVVRKIHKADQHPNIDPDTGDVTPRWDSQDWVSPSTLKSGEDGNHINDYENGDLGGYHKEEVYNAGIKAVTGVPALDINGDGIFSGNFLEKDGWGYRVVNYHYLHYEQDNVYNSGSTPNDSVCRGGFKSTANGCPSLYFPNGYDPSALPGATSAGILTNPSGKIATKRNLSGKSDIVTLPGGEGSNPHEVERFIRSDTWKYRDDGSGGLELHANASSTDNVTFPLWTKTRGSKHAMSLHDPWPLVVDWRARSSDFNVMYYSPTNKYEPWPGLNDASFNSARSNPHERTEGVVDPNTDGYDLATNLARLQDREGNTLTEHGLPGAGFVYEVWVDDAGTLPSRSRPEWQIGNSKCSSSTGSYKLTAEDIAASASGAGIVDPGTGDILVEDDYSCFTYLDNGDGTVDLWDSHYRVEVRNDTILVQKVRRSPHLKGEQLYTDSLYVTGSDYYWDANDGRTGSVSGTYQFSTEQLKGWRVALSDTRVLDSWSYEIGGYSDIYDSPLCIAILGKDKDNSAACRPLAQIKQNAANWYQYSRKRSFVAKGAIAALIDELPGLNYGLMATSRSHVKDDSDATVVELETDISKLFRDVYDGSGSGNGNSDQTTHNSALQESLYEHKWRQSGTPLRQSLQRAGEYFAGRGPDLSGLTPSVKTDPDNHSTSPITESCQKNFAILMTDGYWGGLSPDSVDDQDEDTYSGTLADVAKKYYDEDLATDIDNQVPVDSFDPNDAQHLTTIGVGFGVTGQLTDTNGDGWPGSADASGALPYTEKSKWGGNPLLNDSAHRKFKIDDLWHAAYNSRGLYLNAKNPEELIQRLNDAILFATATVGSASAVSVNLNTLSSSTRVYQTTFKSGEWSGDLQSFPFSLPSGHLLAAEWSAQDKLDDRLAADRNIYTLNAAGERVPFLIASLDADQVDELRKKWPSTSPISTDTTVSLAFAQSQLDYLRGEENTDFRDRSGHKLGDIVHSEPVYVAGPKLPYANLDGDYTQFRSDNLGRAPTVYLGANDGMLHAFDASTGVELFAYIPSMLIPKLNSLSHKKTTTQDFSHKYFVDASPAVGDAYYDSDWHTVLVGGLGGGGKGIYALDITSAPADKEPKVMWEFSDADDADMGYSFSKPSIVKLDDDDWYAIFGNGYNSTAGKAVLYVVNLETKDYKKITSHNGTSNGLSTPSVIDTDGDLIADRVYAGDLLGNVWSFDLTSFNINAGGGSVSGGDLLFSGATDQPITSKITVQEHPLGALAGYLLHFGTGKFFSSTDNDSSDQATQSLYALWDCQDSSCSSITRSNLLEQEIIQEVQHSTISADLRVTSDTAMTWLDSTAVQVGDSGWKGHISKKGWYMDLVNPGNASSTPALPSGNYGERVISKAVIFGHSVLYSTLLPSEDACDGGGSGWLMSLRAETGGRFDSSPFDVNGDRSFTSADFASWTDSDGDSQSTAASGVKSKKGIPSLPVLIGGSNGNAIAISDHSSAEIGIAGGADSASGESDCTAGICGVSGGNEAGRQSWIQID